MKKILFFTFIFIFSVLGIIYSWDPTPTERFTDNVGSHTVTDNATGLIWEKCIADQNFDGDGCDAADNAKVKTWQAALAYCEGLGLGGKNDWRLPNINELYSLIDLTKTSSDTYGIDDLFSMGNDLYYWTSTVMPGGTGFYPHARVIIFTISDPRYMYYQNKVTYPCHARCVRGPD